MSEVPKKRWLKRVFYAVLLLCVLFLFCVPTMLFTDIPPRISKETTYLTEPLTADGKRIDYFLALEQRRYPPQMQTDDNGARLIAQAFGPPKEMTDPLLRAQYYEKLGLSPTHTPTTPYIDLWAYAKNRFAVEPELLEEMKSLCRELKIAEVREKWDDLKKERTAEIEADAALTPEQKEKRLADLQAEAEADTANQIAGIEAGVMNDSDITSYFVYDYKKKSAFPLLEPWLVEAGPALDIIAEAVRKPCFVISRVRHSDQNPLIETSFIGDVQTHRDFTRSLQSRAFYRLENGEIDGAIDDIITIRRLGRLGGNLGMMIDSLVGQAIEGIGVAFGLNGNPDAPMSTEQIERYLQEIDALPQKIDVALIAENERLFALDFIQFIAFSPDRAQELSDFIDSTFSVSGASGSFFSQAPAWIIGRLGYNWNLVLKQVNQEFDHASDPLTAASVSKRSNNPLVWLGTNTRSRELGILLGEMSTLHYTYNESTRRSECIERIQRIILAMLLFERQHGTLPPAFTVDAAGKPLHGWRVLLLPYLGEKELYDKIRLDEAWDSEHNRQFHQTTVAAYQCPSAVLDSETHGVTTAEGGTNYTVIVGDETPFGADGQGRLAKDFGPCTILVAEHRDFVPWMKPDADVSQVDAESFIAATGSQIGSFHVLGANFGFLSGSACFLPNTPSPDHLRKLLRGTAKKIW